MKSNILIAFFLIYLFAGANQGLCNRPSSAPPEYNIARPAKDQVQPINRLRGKRSIGEIILRKRNPVPPVIHEKVRPPVEFYLDPPKFSIRDKFRLA